MNKEQCIDNKELVPIGVPPFYIGDEQRMVELVNAISRYLVYATKRIKIEEAKDAYMHIAKWAHELKLRAELEIELIEEEKKV